jgi:hypothetical protein
MSPANPKRKTIRLTDAAKKKLRPERYCSDTEHSRCYKTPVHFSMCRPHADEHMNKLLRRIVVPNEGVVCEAAAWHAHLFRCSSDIQVNHVFRRGRMLTRWMLDNVIAGCSALNTWAYHHEDYWHHLYRNWRGDAAYKALEAIAFGKAKVDWDEPHRALHARLGESCEMLKEAA